MLPDQLLRYIIQPKLADMGEKFNRLGADILLLATAAQETHCGEYVHQINGPALGYLQVEPVTHDRILDWTNRNLPERAAWLQLHFFRANVHHHAKLVFDWGYSTIIARLLYYSWPDPLPPMDADSMFAYYKKCYNSAGGAATLTQWRQNWQTYVEPILEPQ